MKCKTRARRAFGKGSGVLVAKHRCCGGEVRWTSERVRARVRRRRRLEWLANLALTGGSAAARSGLLSQHRRSSTAVPGGGQEPTVGPVRPAAAPDARARTSWMLWWTRRVRAE